jgi:hypothetical protein|tara:strand:+ start:1206 stop:1598 length:393 start_codon:yes stop_codon:yes gene_type:complete
VKSVPETAAAAFGTMPAGDGIAFLVIQTYPLDSTFFGPLVQFLTGLLYIESYPLFVGRTLSPTDPIVECQVRAIRDSFFPLERRVYDATASTGYRGCATKMVFLFQNDYFGPGFPCLNAGGYANRTRTND